MVEGLAFVQKYTSRQTRGRAEEIFWTNLSGDTKLEAVKANLSSKGETCEYIQRIEQQILSNRDR